MSQLLASGGQSIGISASASILPMNMRTDLLYDGLVGSSAVQGTLLQHQGSLLQHHSSKASILQYSAFFYSPTLTSIHDYWKKTIALSRQTFVDKVTSLLFNMLSGLVITFLPRSKHLLISWLQSPTAVILEPPKK